MNKLGYILTGKSDRCLYRCLIIQDSKTDKSVVSLGVPIGSFHQPRNIQGLAHFLEHMLFMGTKKYPKINEYSEFIAKNSGQYNAYTAHQQTNYHFQVSNNAIEKALDIFAQFFISPMFYQKYLMKQMNAVDSQHKSYLLDDENRIYQLFKYASNPSSRFHSFNTGNLQTLNIPNIRNHILQLYNEKYSANLMKLVVYSNKQLDYMQNIIEPVFSGIPNLNKKQKQIGDVPFQKQQLGKLFKIFPVKDKNKMYLFFIFQDLAKYFKNCPLKYLSYLLGHQGQNSLLSALIEQGLALSIIAEVEYELSFYSSLTLQLQLTEKGIHQYPKLLEIIGLYIKMLKEKGNQRRLFQQIKNEAQLKFDYYDKRRNSQQISKLAINMIKYPIQYVNKITYLMEQYNPQLIQNVINQLNIQNSIIFLQSKIFAEECNQIQLIYGIKYNKEDISQEIIRKFNYPQIKNKIVLDIPPKNLYVPDDLTFFEGCNITEHPVKIHESKFCSLYFKQDNKFMLPKVSISMKINYKYENTALSKCYLQICQKIIKMDLKEIIYMGKLALINFNIRFDRDFAEIQFQGFNDKIHLFVEQILKVICQLRPNKYPHFGQIVQEVKNSAYNNLVKSPFKYGMILQEQIILTNCVSNERILEQIGNVLIDQIQTWYKQLLSNIFVDVLILGNYKENMSRKIIDIIESNFDQKLTKKKLDYKNMLEIRTVSIPQKTKWFIAKQLLLKEQTNNCLISHFQYQIDNPQNKMRIELINKYLNQPAFNYFRTESQLGYIVFVYTSNNRGQLGLSILIQSQKSPASIFTNMKEFIQQICKRSEKMDQQQFNQYKQSLLQQLMDEPKNLKEQKFLYFNEIIKRSYQFNRIQLSIEVLKKIQLNIFQKEVQNILKNKLKYIEVQIVSTNLLKINQQINKSRIQKGQIKDGKKPTNFIRGLKLNPDYYLINQ